MVTQGLREPTKRGVGIGEFIREQRERADVSLRQLSRLAGVSNPYLSQIERGLRKPSAEILQQIAKALRISAEQLYVQAGILDEREVSLPTVAAVLADDDLDDRHKRILIEIYEAFRAQRAFSRSSTASQGLSRTLTMLPVSTVPEPPR